MIPNKINMPTAYDQLIETLIIFCRPRKADNDGKCATGSRGIVAAVASKLFEITYAMREVERELEALKSVIIEDLQRHESAAAMAGRLQACCDRLAAFIAEILDARRMQDANREEVDENYAPQLREIIRDVFDIRDDFVDEITSIEQGLVIVTTRLEDMAACIKFEITENCAFHACVIGKEKGLLQRGRELVGKLKELKTSENWKKVRKIIKDETFAFH